MADYTLNYSGQEVDNILSGSQSHIANKSNPHEVTKSQVGLGNVDNTSDADKPVSTAMQTALNGKASEASLSEHTGNINNPHSVTKSQVGLGNVNNTSDADKPISTATQTALDGKASTGDVTAEAALRVAGDNALGQRIDNLSLAGRFLAGWDASTGLATSNPSVSPYSYRSGDFFIVSKTGTTNYKPTGNSYVIGQASTAVETNTLKVGYFYKYDGTAWSIIPIQVQDILWGNIGGNITDQTDLQNALTALQTSINGKYSKPASGIPESDLASAVRAYLKNEIFLCTKNETTYQEIKDAVAAGKIAMVIDENNPYYCSGIWSNFLNFYSIGTNEGFSVSVGGTWSWRNNTLEDIGNKETTLANFLTNIASTTKYPSNAVVDAFAERKSNKVTSLSAQSTDTEYPSAKCVYDLVGNVESLIDSIRGI